MALGAKVNSAGASFILLSPKNTMLKSSRPVIAVCAVRTGCGKSQTSRRVAEILMSSGLKVIIVRHPMPYGDLSAQKVQRFASIKDLAKHNCTIEEMEEYEPHIVRGNVVYAGVDYEAILRTAEKDPSGCDVILWDGGNNDFPFFKPDLMITVTDPHRPGHELSYYPGEITLRLADVVVINKIDSADFDSIQQLRANIELANPRAVVVDAASAISVDKPDIIKGKRVLVIEDGPTLTHGEMKIGAGIVAARRYGAAEIVDPRPYAVGKLAETYKIYPDIGKVLPAMGYGKKQVNDLAATIKKAKCDSVVIATPIDLARVIKIKKPSTRVTYSLQEIGHPDIADVLKPFLIKQPGTL
jgi:predicted GTPase